MGVRDSTNKRYCKTVSFAVSFTPETPNFGTIDGVAHPHRGIKKKTLLLLKCLHAHI